MTMSYREFLEDVEWVDVHGLEDWDWEADFGSATATVTAEGDFFSIDIAYGHGADVWHQEKDGYESARSAQDGAAELYWQTIVEEAEVARAEALVDQRREEAEYWRRY